MPKFVPDKWTASDTLLKWAVDNFRVEQNEVLRQVELMRDHEFRRNYTCWDRVFRNWMRKAEEIGSLKRPISHRKPEELSDEQRQADILAFERDMKRLGVK